MASKPKQNLDLSWLIGYTLTFPYLSLGIIQKLVNTESALIATSICHNCRRTLMRRNG